jgi:acyl-CoA thioester hydrolase
MKEPLLTYRGTVYPWHCDHMGHMNVMWYVGKFDEATWNLFAGFGLTPHWLREQGRGMVAVEQRLLYKAELHAGDVLSVHSSVLEVRDKTIRFLHEMRKLDGQVAATTELTGVHLDTVVRRSVPLPAEVRERALAAVLEP